MNLGRSPGGTMADVADVLGISEYIARRHYAKWSPARQQRISSIMPLVQSGRAITEPVARDAAPGVIQ